jgi:hypothetical protein
MNCNRCLDSGYYGTSSGNTTCDCGAAKRHKALDLALEAAKLDLEAAKLRLDLVKFMVRKLKRR